MFNFFELSEDGEHYICQCSVEKDGQESICGTKISANVGSARNAPSRASNLKRHMSRLHPKEEIADTTLAPTSSSKKGDASKHDAFKSFFGQKISVSMTGENFRRYIVEMVAKEGIPLSFFSSSAFIGLNGEMARKLGVALSRDSVRNLVIESATLRKEELVEHVRGRFVFLKMDACTRQRVNYFAINLQFVGNEGTPVIRTLAVRDTQAQHTNEYLQKLISDILEEFQIRKDQVLLVVTDNASNMISTIRKLNTTDVADGDEAQADDGDVDDFADAAARMTKIHHMRCAVHTLQLAVRDGLKEPQTASLVSKVRNMATAARAPKLHAILQRRAGKGAIIDQATRWGSTFLMIERVLELKPFLVEMAVPDLTDEEWEGVHQLASVLKRPFLATKVLQSDNLTPGAFLKEWKALIYHLPRLGGELAAGIAGSMLRREATLLDNDVLMAAVYVDPKYRVMLTEAQTARAKEALYEVAVRINGVADREDVPTAIQDTASSSSNNEDEEAETSFEKHLDVQEKSKRRRVEPAVAERLSAVENFRRDFYTALPEVEIINRESNVTVIEAIPRYPELVRAAASAVTALPCTQVSVERLFSALRFIRSDLRGSMKTDLLEAILFLRTNTFFGKDC